MITQSRRIRRFLPAILIVGLVVMSKTDAYGGGRGGHSGGHAARAPHFAGGQRAYKAPRMSHPATSARVNTASTRANTAGARTNTTGTRANTASARTNTAGTRAQGQTGQAHGTRGQSLASNTRSGAATSAALNPTGATSNGLSSNAYTYGTGNGARNYRAYGYGNGYRNRSYRRGSGYGRSQGTNRAVVARLRSVHTSLARINHDYQGHRANAMRSVSMAIRQLSHRSSGYSRAGFSSGMNNGRAMGMRQGGGGVNAGNRQRQPMSQAQSDARMSQNLRTLQGINMQLSNSSQGNFTSGHGQATGHVQRAIRELHVGLSIR